MRILLYFLKPKHYWMIYKMECWKCSTQSNFRQIIPSETKLRYFHHGLIRAFPSEANFSECSIPSANLSKLTV